MRKLLIGLALLLSASASSAGPKEEALLVLGKWTKAFTESDIDTIVSLYAPGALFFGTRSAVLVTNASGIRTYFDQILLTGKPHTAALLEHSVQVLSDTVVVVTGRDTLTGVRDGKDVVSSGRVTFVFAKSGENWQIVHFHRSSVPT